MAASQQGNGPSQACPQSIYLVTRRAHVSSTSLRQNRDPGDEPEAAGTASLFGNKPPPRPASAASAVVTEADLSMSLVLGVIGIMEKWKLLYYNRVT